MNGVLNALYELLCYVTEDIRNQLPEELFKPLNDAANAVGEYLDKRDKE